MASRAAAGRKRLASQRARAPEEAPSRNLSPYPSPPMSNSRYGALVPKQTTPNMSGPTAFAQTPPGPSLGQQSIFPRAPTSPTSAGGQRKTASSPTPAQTTFSHPSHSLQTHNVLPTPNSPHISSSLRNFAPSASRGPPSYHTTPPSTHNSNMAQSRGPLLSHTSSSSDAITYKPSSQPSLPQQQLLPPHFTAYSSPIPDAFSLQADASHPSLSRPRSPHDLPRYVGQHSNIVSASLSPGSSPLSSSSSPPDSRFQSVEAVSHQSSSTSIARHTPSPIKQFPATSSHTANVNGQLHHQPREFDTATLSSGRASPTSLHVNASASIISSSSGSDSQARPSPSSSVTHSTFVYPTSRSRAVPSSGNGVPRFSFKPKKKKLKPELHVVTQEKPIHEGSSQSTGTSTAYNDPLPTPVPLRPPISVSPQPSGVKPRSTPDPDPPFVFPSSRSRGHPPLKMVRMKGPKKAVSSDSLDDDDSSSHRSSSRFMGIKLNRGKKKTPTTEPSSASPVPPPIVGISDPIIQSTQVDQNNPGREDGSTSHGTDRVGEFQQYYTKVGTYPLDSYDSVLLESDKQTSDLLHLLNASGTPSFHHYGNTPPANVLDLGCGQGHWILRAALAWKGYGTRVTGLDMVDITKNLRGKAAQNGIADNISFVRSNFLKKQLPFPDESFDLVRMSCMTFGISYDKWEFVLKEVSRVLTVGGRLELIDDHVFFPYGKPPLTTPVETSPIDTSPQLDISIPSPRVSMTGGSSQTLSHDLPPRPDSNTIPLHDNGDVYKLYAEEDDGERSDTATVNNMPSSSRRRPLPAAPSTSSMIMSPYPEPWAESAAVSRDLESLFENMMNMKFGIHLCPSEFVLDMLLRVFGHSREMNTMHLTLAPPEPRPETNSPGDATPEEVNLLLQSPGLILWPSSFIPMSQPEVQAHAQRHSRMLLSCKSALTEYALEINEDDDVESEAVMEALWEYEGFLQQRFSPPPRANSSTSASSLTSNFDQPTARIPFDNIADSGRNSVYSSSSLSSDGHKAMWEYRFDLRHHFAWPLEDKSDSPGTPRASRSKSPDLPQPPQTVESYIPTPEHTPSSTAVQLQTSSTSRKPSSIISSNERRSSVAPPYYSLFEPTHVRTFHVYEAVKMDERMFGAAF